MEVMNGVMKFLTTENLTGDGDGFHIHSIALFVALLCACIVIGHFLEENRWINASITTLVIGLGCGSVILLTTKGKSSRLLEFDEQLFFIYLLPPIIFNAGFQVKKKQFFRNFSVITMFGAVGTLISFCIISFGAKMLLGILDIGSLELQDYLAIGVIFSATDSVCTLQVLKQEETPLLHSVVFGEGVVNDATAVVLFNAIQKFDLSRINLKIAAQFGGNFLTLFITSTLLGIMVGLLCAYIIKELYFGRHSTDREVALMILMAYQSYVIAEVFDLSGILTVFFCGIVMSHYTWHNVSQSSRTTSKHAFATLSYVAEIFIFLYVGMDALDIEKWKFVRDSPGKSIAVSAILLVLVMIGRAAFVFPLSFLSNLTRKSKSDEMEMKQQVTIWWAGLMRGAVSMALAYNQFARSGHTQQQGNAIMITSTITLVLSTNVVFGLATKHLVSALLPPAPLLGLSSEPDSPKSFALALLDMEEEGFEVGEDRTKPRRPSKLRMLLTKPNYTIHYYWRRFDDAIMRPVFGGRGFTRPDSGMLEDVSLH